MTIQGEFTVDDLLGIDILSDAQISTAGDRVACVVAENGSPKGQRSSESRIRIFELGGDRSGWQATYGPGTDRTPRWSPDDRRLAFLSDREKRGTAQVYLLEGTPGEARKLTDLQAGAVEFAWSSDGSQIAVTSTDHVPESDNDVWLLDAERRFRRLYLVDTRTGEARPVNHGDLHVWEFCWSPDGRSIAAIVSDEPYQWGWYDVRLVRIEIESGTVAMLYQSERQIARPVWSPDGSAIALVTCRWSDPGMTGGDVVTIRLDDGDIQNLTEGEPRSHLTVHWLAGGDDLVTFAWDHARAQVCRLGPRGGSRPLWTSERGINDYGGTFSSNAGRLATVLSSINEPPEVWTGRVDEDSGTAMKPVSSINQTTMLPEIRADWLTWQSTDGREIEGLYLSSAETAPASAPPMVTIVHGGPTAAATNSFPLAGATAWSWSLLQRGYAVFVPNYRGSNGYGVAFAEANLGDLGGLDFQDILTGVDECVRRDWADASRLGIGGWSYGGYITAWAITQTDRFRVAVAGASITNWYSFHGGTNIPGFDNQFIGASPHELDGPYAWTSPLFFSKNVRTPTLFLHGERDPVCPAGQAYEMARALRRCGVEAECAVYPREPHGFAERAHRRDMIERASGWLLTHMSGQ